MRPQAKLEAIRMAVEARNDIAYALLLAVVRFPCSESGSTICGVEMGLSCERCRNTGYLTRNWEGLPPGALAGALSLAIWESPLKIYIDVVDLLNERDPDEAACDAVLLGLGVEVPDAV